MYEQFTKHDSLMHPFTPLVVKDGEKGKTVEMSGRRYTVGENSLPVSILAEGEELLAAPIRLVGTENGEEIVWQTDYETNESAAFIQKRTAERVQLLGAMQSESFVANTCIETEYDGYTTMDLKVMPRGLTVAEALGVKEAKKRSYNLSRLWVEIPLKKKFATLYHMFPQTSFYLEDGTVTEETPTSGGGLTPQQNAALPFKALLWLGNEDAGFGYFAETDRNWEIEDENRAIEIVQTDSATVLRIHLLDRQPEAWKPWEGDVDDGRVSYPPVTFRFGFQATPVKPFPKKPYLHNGFHLDCYVKTPGEYHKFLSGPVKEGTDEIGYDRIKRLGVTTLIIHEKWNKSQNWFELSEETAANLKNIVEECHARGIKVLTYFGYELASISPVWAEYEEYVLAKRENGRNLGGWYRVPFQRDYLLCYNNVMQDKFVEGIRYIMDTYHTDGIYLDGTSRPFICYNEKHGCGWRDAKGVLHGTYPIGAVRNLFKGLYEVVEARGGMINVHCAACNNFTALSFIHLNWYGENLQRDYLQGKMGKMPVDYFRAEYTGRNIGTPVELIAYENRPVWTFESAVACSIIHGILPRPNDIGHPLELMSSIWKIFESFPIEQASWHPYWNNGDTVQLSDDRALASYYKYTDPTGREKLLFFISNTTADEIENIEIQLPAHFSKATLLPEQTENVLASGKLSAALGKFGYGIYYVE